MRLLPDERAGVSIHAGPFRGAARMSNVEQRIRSLVAEGRGRASLDVVVAQALGLPQARGLLARRLVASAIAPLRGLAVDGDHVVERAVGPAARRCVLVLAPTKSRTALPAAAAWLALHDGAEPVVVALAGESWRDGTATLARDLAGCEVLALSALSCRRVLRLGSSLAGIAADEEPAVVALAAVARHVGCPLRSSDDAAALVGAEPPGIPEDAARLLVRVATELARRAAIDVAGLRALADRDVPEFEFGERAFSRSDLVALPEAPGVYLFEDAEGDVAYVGKAAHLRRRVSSYFGQAVDERAVRVRDAAHGLTVERTGTELTALLRELQLIRELRPALNVQQEVHARGRAVAAALERGPLAVVQPSAEGGVEVVLLDRACGVETVEVVPEAGAAAIEAVIVGGIERLRARRGGEDETADVETALTWLASDTAASASLVDASGEPREVARCLARVACDEDLDSGRIVPLR
jgi:hypothetical protein